MKLKRLAAEENFLDAGESLVESKKTRFEVSKLLIQNDLHIEVEAVQQSHLSQDSPKLELPRV